jgi:hypothetical protein
MRSPYQSLRIQCADGRSQSIPIGVFDDLDQFRLAVATHGPASSVAKALEAPHAYAFRDAVVRYRTLILSMLGVAIVAVPYATWIAVNTPR